MDNKINSKDTEKYTILGCLCMRVIVEIVINDYYIYNLWFSTVLVYINYL